MSKRRRALWLGAGAGIGAVLIVLAAILVALAPGGAPDRAPRPGAEPAFPSRADIAPGPAASTRTADLSVGGGAPGVSEGSEGAPPTAGNGEGIASPPLDDAVARPPDLEPQPCDFPQFIGQRVDEQALKATGRPYRILPPGASATMDFSPARINVEVDDADTVIRVSCG